MNVLIVVSSLKMGGGAEKIAYTIGINLQKMDHNVFFLTFYDFEPRYRVQNYYSLAEKQNKNILSKMSKLLSRAYKILKICKEKEIDLLISFMEEPNFSVLLSRYLGNKNRILISIRQSPTIYSCLYKSLIKILYPKADIIVSVSKEIEFILNKYYRIPKNRIKTIYNPHHVNEYQHLSRERLEERYQNIFNNSFVFINVGRLAEQKGQWFLIRAFKKVVNEYPRVKLVILGDGELRNELRDLINKLNLQNNVYLLGMQKNPFKFLRHSGCFVFPSLWEGLPNSIIEALSLNLPVISTDCKTGPREILCPELNIYDKINYPYYGKYGILIPPFPRCFIWDDLDKRPLLKGEKILAKLMIKMVEYGSMNKKYSKGLERAKDFDIEKIMYEWIKLLVFL